MLRRRLPGSWVQLYLVSAWAALRKRLVLSQALSEALGSDIRFGRTKLVIKLLKPEQALSENEAATKYGSTVGLLALFLLFFSGGG